MRLLFICSNIFFEISASPASADAVLAFLPKQKAENISVFSSFTESVCRADSVTALSEQLPAFLRALCRQR